MVLFISSAPCRSTKAKPSCLDGLLGGFTPASELTPEQCEVSTRSVSANPASVPFLRVSRAHLSGPAAGNVHLRVCFLQTPTYQIFEKQSNKQTSKNTKIQDLSRCAPYLKAILQGTTPKLGYRFINHGQISCKVKVTSSF